MKYTFVLYHIIVETNSFLSYVDINIEGWKKYKQFKHNKKKEKENRNERE